MIRTQVQLTEEQMSVLKEQAKLEQVSIAELIRRAVESSVMRSPRVSRAELKKRAHCATGRFASGHSDISANHDHYLNDAFGE